MDSVEQQRYEALEVVVQDACSTDGSLDLMERRARRIPGLRIVSEPDAGIGDAYNRAIRRCQGAIIGTVDADNELEPDAVPMVVEAFRRFPYAAAIYGANRYIDPYGRSLGLFRPPPFSMDRVVVCEVVPPFASSFYSRSVCGPELRFDPSLETCADFELWLRLGDLPIVSVSAVLARVRLSGKSMTRRGETYAQFCKDKVRSVARYLGDAGCGPGTLTYRSAVAGIYLWGAESLLEVEGPTKRFRALLEEAESFDDGSARLARLRARLRAELGSDHVDDRGLLAAEVRQAADQEDDHRARGRQQQQARSLPSPGDRPPEALDDPRQRVELVEPAPA
jgi:hypothetical protein